MQNIPVKIEYMALPDALKRGALAFFGDKYNPEKVRLVDVPDFSVELCGGTHVKATGDIGVFKITEISALSAGHRRITAVTGPRALELFQESFAIVKGLSQDFKVPREHVLDAIAKQQEEVKKAHHELEKIKKQMLLAHIPQLLEQTTMIGSKAFLYHSFNNASHEELKEIAQQLAHKKNGFYFLTSTTDGKNIFFAMSSPSLAIDMKKIAQLLKDAYGIKGGGSGTMLQGSATELHENIKTDLAQWIKEN